MTGQVDAVFEQHRPLLLGLGYRMLGSMWDAEDVVQEAYLRWLRTDRDEVLEPRAFLVTVVSRLALDQLRSARVKREAYTGPWLPEPVRTEAFGPSELAELQDTLSYATLHLMERLTPPQRAVFVLREAFDLPYEDIAGIIGDTAVNCRQLHRRAAKRLADGRDRFRPSRAEHGELLARFLDAARSGDLDTLKELFSEDVVAYNDGGGKVRAALRPIVGRDNVLAFVAGLMTRYPIDEIRLAEANGEPAVWTVVGGQGQLVTIDVRDGLIHAVYGILNPDKLSHIRPVQGVSMSTLTPHLVVRDPERAARWYAEAFGAEEVSRVPLPGGKVMTIELRFGDSTVNIADEFPDYDIVSPLTLGGTYGALQIATEDAEALWKRATDAGAEVFRPLSDVFWGERHGQVIDPFGHRWGISQRLRDVSPEEIEREAAKAFGT